MIVCRTVAVSLVSALPLITARATGLSTSMPRAADSRVAPPSGAGSSGPAIFDILPAQQARGRPLQRVFVFTVAPGHTFSARLAVVNPGTAPVAVKLSVSDALTRPRGGGIMFRFGGTQQHVGHWVRLAVSRITVPAGYVTTVPLLVSLPAFTRPGQYEGSINAVNAQPIVIRTGQTGVSLGVQRQCVVFLRVTGTATRGLAVTGVRVTGPGNRAALLVELHNTGTVIDYPMSTSIALVGPQGTFTWRPGTGTIMGHDATTLSMAIGRSVPPGSYHVRVRIAYMAKSAQSRPIQPFVMDWSGHISVSRDGSARQ